MERWIFKLTNFNKFLIEFKIIELKVKEIENREFIFNKGEK